MLFIIIFGTLSFPIKLFKIWDGLLHILQLALAYHCRCALCSEVHFLHCYNSCHCRLCVMLLPFSDNIIYLFTSFWWLKPVAADTCRISGVWLIIFAVLLFSAHTLKPRSHRRTEPNWHVGSFQLNQAVWTGLITAYSPAASNRMKRYTHDNELPEAGALCLHDT